MGGKKPSPHGAVFTMLEGRDAATTSTACAGRLLSREVAGRIAVVFEALPTIALSRAGVVSASLHLSMKLFARRGCGEVRSR